ncbi:MAG: hypothetical protein VKK42_07440, partial [Lyngbya sp.]|nr:hypothetical protein [Lyngbya sp.]
MRAKEIKINPQLRIQILFILSLGYIRISQVPLLVPPMAGLFHSQLKIAGGSGGDGGMGRWGEDFFPMKNSFLLIKIPP